MHQRDCQVSDQFPAAPFATIAQTCTRPEMLRCDDRNELSPFVQEKCPTKSSWSDHGTIVQRFIRNLWSVGIRGALSRVSRIMRHQPIICSCKPAVCVCSACEQGSSATIVLLGLVFPVSTSTAFGSWSSQIHCAAVNPSNCVLPSRCSLKLGRGRRYIVSTSLYSHWNSHLEH